MRARCPRCFGPLNKDNRSCECGWVSKRSEPEVAGSTLHTFILLYLIFVLVVLNIVAWAANNPGNETVTPVGAERSYDQAAP